MRALRQIPAVALAFLLFSGPLAAADYGGVKVIAHRGAGYEYDENTVEACRQSYERGIRGYEVDVRLTKDGHLVLMHDADASRTTDGQGKVEEMTLSEIRTLRTKEKGVPVPTVEELFDYFRDKPDVYLMLEMKTTDKTAYPDEAIEPYCRKLHEAAQRLLPPDTYCFISFDHRALAAVHRIDSGAFTGYLSSKAPTEEMIAEAKALGCGRMSVPIETTTRQMARKIKEAGLQLSLWPIRQKEDADLAVLWGAAIICTDTPSDLLGIAPAN
ncbi:MAG TPA: glycerophosphodiester phosphodiesterase family protein, partial [Bacteroidia bacterium]|nr:glycerophosphodiester phosphodiesterase family protein [Bacteroidia bacterium]